VEILWRDASADDQDHSIENLEKNKPWICHRKTLGYYIFTRDGFYILCADQTTAHSVKQLTDKDENFSSLLSVPVVLGKLRVVESHQQGKRKRKARI